jgi:hypothetical protein
VSAKIGTAIVSYIEAQPGQDAAFDHWYGTDHFPFAVLAGPGIIGGARFVATDACKAARPPTATLFGDPGRGTHLAVAWLEPGMQHSWDAWVVDTMRELTAQNRLFPGREHVHTAVYNCLATDGDPTAGPFAGVIALATTGTRPLPAPARPSATLQLERTIVSSSEPAPHLLTLAFCGKDPVATLREHPAPADAAYAGPFVANPRVEE